MEPIGLSFCHLNAKVVSTFFQIGTFIEMSENSFSDDGLAVQIQLGIYLKSK